MQYQPNDQQAYKMRVLKRRNVVLFVNFHKKNLPLLLKIEWNEKLKQPKQNIKLNYKIKNSKYQLSFLGTVLVGNLIGK